jgi:hypothetical protein
MDRLEKDVRNVHGGSTHTTYGPNFPRSTTTLGEDRTLERDQEFDAHTGKMIQDTTLDESGNYYVDEYDAQCNQRSSQDCNNLEPPVPSAELGWRGEGNEALH